ncbi:calcyphosin-like protein isoform X2 [Gigantopelta aegis]|nr:calcyphosin-like protein isoform X2 [Gigantopelta aegis]XP_041356969.1 calcyphosin-like protein isoform X2 [Gigantopelta aegis]XP_041356970.1 calcyphosin-like protein isoform X2 [Gigantopelta aegis]
MAATSKLNAEIIRRAKAKALNETDPVEKFKQLLLARGAKGIKNISRSFRIMDDDRSGQLNFNEFLTGCRDVGMDLEDFSKEDLNAVFKQFDVDDSGSLSVTEFLRIVRPKMSPNREKLVSMAYSKLDKTGDEKVTVEDLQGVYDVSQHPKYQNGEWDQNRCLREFLDTFDSSKHKDGLVTFEEFKNYYSAISCGIDDDSYFDLMMRKSWGL